MSGLGWTLYRVLRALLLPGLSAGDRREMDELIALRRKLAKEPGGAAAGVWIRELVDLVRVARRRLRLPRLGVSWIDIKLGFRMLVKEPAVTAVAIFALGVGIPAGLAPWQFVNAIEAPLPVDEGERIRALRYWNVATSRSAMPTLYDYERWRGQLPAFAQIGAARMGSYNVDSDSGVAEPVLGAEVTASVFDLLRVPPDVGRTLDATDESIDGPAVVVLGHEVWQTRFGGDPTILGTSIAINGEPHTVVGVMPAGFRFPIRHQLWRPLRARAGAEPRDGLPLIVVGRLADSATLQESQVQLEAVARRLAVEFPDAYARLQPEVVPMANVGFGLPRAGIRSAPDYYIGQFVALLLLSVACVNVALLVFARTANRTLELAVRTALGASRGRIVVQVFTESLVLALVAAGVGLVLIDWLPGRLLDIANITPLLPYWVDPGVTPGTAVAAVLLAVFSAVIAGVIPALRTTGRSVVGNIQRGHVGASGTRFGGLSSILIVADVAIAVIVVAAGVAVTDVVLDAVDPRDGVGIDAEEFLAVELRLPGDAAAEADESERLAFAARLGEVQRELVRRLVAEPGVRGVAAGSALPRMDHRMVAVELDGEPPTSATADWDERTRARVARVDVDFLDALGQPVLSGRAFDSSDVAEGEPGTAIVNTSFVDRVLNGRNPIGRRLRLTPYGSVPGPWYEVVGVVGHLGMHVLQPSMDEGIYIPAAPGTIHPVQLAVHVGTDPEAFTPRLRTIARDVDPTAAIRSPIALDKVFEGDWYVMAGVVLGAGALVGILLALAASALYAIMSFTVAQRTREIGIRAALGARSRTIAFTVARRALIQITLGVALGLPLAGRILFEVAGEDTAAMGWAAAGMIVLGVGVMGLIALTACAVPTLRALRIMPTEALRS